MKKRILSLILAAVMLVSLVPCAFAEHDYVEYQGEWPYPRRSKVANIIFDSDCGPDCDDAGALAILHHYADTGNAEILAAVCSTTTEYGAAWLDAINTYYGRPDIPIGTTKTSKDIQSDADIFNSAIAFGWDNDIYSSVNARDAVEVYRETLAAAEDNSVTIVCLGMLTNLADLLQSSADRYSKLDGYELVKKKVKLVSCMGGNSVDPNQREFNIKCDVESAQYVADNWPTPIVFSGFEIGDTIMTGGTRDTMEEDNPIRASYDLYCGVDVTRPSWDLTSVLYAVEGTSAYWTEKRGDVRFTDLGETRFTENMATGARSFLVPSMSDDSMAIVLDKLMTSAKKSDLDCRVGEITDISKKVAEITFSGAVEPVLGKHLFYKDTAMVLDAKDEKATFTFEGYGIDIWGRKTNKSAIAEVYIDGKLYGKVDFCSKTDLGNVPVFSASDLSGGKHTIEIVNTGNKTLSSTGKDVIIDFFKVYKDEAIGSAKSFADVEKDEWYYDAIDYMTANKYMNGLEKDRFGVQIAMTRAQLATVLYRMAGAPDMSGESVPYKDIPEDSWYTDAVKWAVKNGIMEGTSKKKFAPHDVITRQEAVSALCSYAGGTGDPMEWAVKKKIINGVAEDNLGAEELATRAQVCTMLARYLQK